MSHASRQSNNGFVVACPSHPAVILMRQKRRGLFGRRRVEVVQDECPFCVQELPQDPPVEESYSWNTSYRGSFQPTAPYDDHYMEDETESRRCGEPYHSEQHRSSINVPVAQNQPTLTQSIMEMVHALLDRENPTRGPNFVVDQLEMLCAWSLGDDGVRLIIVDSGGIYIVVNVLKQCLEQLGRPSDFANDNGNLTVNPSAQIHEPSHFRAETTLPTQTLDDATTIVTNEAELEDTIAEFDSMYDDNLPFPQNNAQFIAGATTSTADDFSRTSLSYPGSLYFPPHRNSTSNVFPGASNQTPSTTSSFNQSFAHEQAGRPRTSTLPYQHQNIISPPPPTMDDIDRAFGHFLSSPTGPTSTTDGQTVATPSYQGRPSYQGQPWHSSYSTASTTQVMPATVGQDAFSYAPSIAAGSTANNTTFSRRAPSVSGSSVSAYISPRVPGRMQQNRTTSSSHVGGSGQTDRVIQEARWGVATLANLSRDQVSVDVIRSAKGIETLLALMSRCETDEMLQDCGCECLSSLVTRGTPESRLIKGMIVSYGGVSIVLKSMRLFPATPTLQHKCCLFISRVAVSDPVVLQSIATLHGIELITLAMRLHRTDEELQDSACLALVTLLREDMQLRVAIVAAQGHEAILTAMWQFDANGLIQCYGSESLGYICANDDRNKQLLTEAGAVETILSSMRSHNGNADVQRAGSRALGYLTENYRPAIERANQNDGITRIRGAAVHDPENAKRVETRLLQHQ